MTQKNIDPPISKNLFLVILLKITQTTISIKVLFQLISLSSFILFILGFLGRYSKLCELIVNFRLQYAIISLFSAIILLIIDKKHLFSILAIVNAIIMNSTLIPFYIPNSYKKIKPALNTTTNIQNIAIKVMSINVNTNNKQYSKVIKTVIEESPDILILEEVSKKWITELHELNQYYPFSKLYPEEDNFGIAFFSKYKPTKVSVCFFGTPSIPYICAEFERPSKFVFFGIHTLPPILQTNYQHRNKMLEYITKKINKIRNKQVVVMGDFNMTPWSYFFNKFMTESDLKNTQYGFGLQPSWPTSFIPLRIPIDHCLVSKSIPILSRNIGEDIGSDHFPIIVQLLLPSSLNKN
jgi:endonuclease/exonuclease/phosphatase (EEP) superfamily protein YafD